MGSRRPYTPESGSTCPCKRPWSRGPPTNRASSASPPPTPGRSSRAPRLRHHMPSGSGSGRKLLVLLKQQVAGADIPRGSMRRSSQAHEDGPREAWSASAPGTRCRTAGRPPLQARARLAEAVSSRPSCPQVKARRTLYGLLRGRPKRTAPQRVRHPTPPTVMARPRTPRLPRRTPSAPAPRPAPAGTRSPATPSTPLPACACTARTPASPP